MSQQAINDAHQRTLNAHQRSIDAQRDSVSHLLQMLQILSDRLDRIEYDIRSLRET